MFLGSFSQNITDGSRLALPKKIREEVEGEEVILSKGFEQCIFGYQPEDWEAEAEKQIETPISSSKTRNLKRYMYSGAARLSFDSQGRFVIPSELKDYAGIEDKAVVIGAGDHFEIWDEKVWQEHLNLIEKEVLRE